MEVNIIQIFIVVSLAFYWIFDFFDNRQVKDERYELIRLKTIEFVQKLTLLVLSLVSVVFLIFPQMPAIVPIMAFIGCSLYGEVVGKLFYRRRF